MSRKSEFQSSVLYHGTSVDLLPGDIVEPGTDGVAWAAREPWYAARRAVVKNQDDPKRTNYPRIYTVEPLGETTDSYDKNMLIKPNKGEGKHVTSKDGFIVTGEHTPDESEWDKHLFKGVNRYRKSAGMPNLSLRKRAGIFRSSSRKRPGLELE
jgi:hypothetical protein